MFKKGSIVLIPFPFTDLSGQKIRPALVLSEVSAKGEDFIVAFISSQSKKITAFDVPIQAKEKSFFSTGLKVSSIVKVNKIATLDKKICLGEIGNIDAITQKEVEKKLRIIFQI